MKSKSKLSVVAGVMFALAATSSAGPAASETPIDDRSSTPAGSLDAGPDSDADVRPMAGEPDNSERNVRDRDGDTLTPTDQSNAASDIEMTQKIRKGITSNDSMSVQARNVKIITQRGVVTLRGPVKTAQEKAAIEALAKNAGAARIDNQLEIDRDIPSGEKG